jgi:predicted O-methyltransferase YrrM
MPIKNASAFSAAIKHPLAALAFKLGNKAAMHDALILDSAKYLLGEDTDLTIWKNALAELKNNDLIAPNENKHQTIVGNNLNTTFGKWIYCCIRVTKPETVIETGVAHGYSSWIILNALKKNNKGVLYSIDLPNHDTNIDYNFKDQPTTGWMVPDILKDRWKLNLGDAKILLPTILKEIGELSIFFHDSDHSYEHMKYEFETSHPYLINGGLLLSDDVHKNAAFAEHVELNTLRALQFNKGGAAIIRK